jgi:hypothetical protein
MNNASLYDRSAEGGIIVTQRYMEKPEFLYRKIKFIFDAFYQKTGLSVLWQPE